MQGKCTTENNRYEEPKSNITNEIFCHIVSIAHSVYFRYEADEKTENDARFYRWIY